MNKRDRKLSNDYVNCLTELDLRYLGRLDIKAAYIEGLYQGRKDAEDVVEKLLSAKINVNHVVSQNPMIMKHPLFCLAMDQLDEALETWNKLTGPDEGEK